VRRPHDIMFATGKPYTRCRKVFPNETLDKLSIILISKGNETFYLMKAFINRAAKVGNLCTQIRTNNVKLDLLVL
jgi:hypothetical protein